MIRAALATDRPRIMDFIVNPAEKVSPMVPAGATLSEIMELEWCEEGISATWRRSIADARKAIFGEEGCR